MRIVGDHTLEELYAILDKLKTYPDLEKAEMIFYHNDEITSLPRVERL